MRFRRYLVGLIAALPLFLSLASCANQGAHLRAQPVMFMETPLTGEQRSVKITLPPIEDGTAPPAAPADSTPVKLASLNPAAAAVPAAGEPTKQEAGVLELKCVRLSNVLNREETTEATPRQPAQCLYMSVDMQDLFQQPIRNSRERNRIVYFLMNISDANCTTFLHRFYANRAGWDAAHGTGKDVATAIASGTAQVAAGLSGALGLLNLAGGTAIDNINKSFYSEKTIQAITAAIKSLRATSKKRVIEGAGKPLAEYSYFEALDDLENFDHDCSLQRGVEQLAELANNASFQAEDKLEKLKVASVVDLQKDLDATRKERDEALRLRTEFQQQFLKAKDEAERTALQNQIKNLTDQVQKSNDEITKLRSSLPSGTTSKEAIADKPPATTTPPTTTPGSGK